MIWMALHSAFSMHMLQDVKFIMNHACYSKSIHCTRLCIVPLVHRATGPCHLARPAGLEFDFKLKGYVHVYCYWSAF